MTTEREWELRAVCRTQDPETFFKKATRAVARSTCEGCPVKAECLEVVMAREEGLSSGYRHGIFAGLTGPERAALARARGEQERAEAPEEPRRPVKRRGPGRSPAPCGTRAAYQRHLSKGEPMDACSCREAHAQGARAYRATGSTKVPTAR